MSAASSTSATDAAGFTGSIPEHYDQGLGPILFADFAEDIARRAAAGAPARVLETAAGTGIATRRLRDLLPPHAQLTATDLNPPMLEVARRKFRDDEQVTFQPADALALPFKDGAFDAVVCQFGVMFYPDKDRSFREAHRVLAPGGRYLFSVWDSPRHNAFGRIADDAIGRSFPDGGPRFYSRVPLGYHAIDPIKEALLAAGFAGLSATVLRREKTIPDADAFARGLVLGNPLVEDIRRRGIDPAAVVAATAAALRTEFGADPGHTTLQAIVFEARRAAADGA